MIQSVCQAMEQERKKGGALVCFESFSMEQIAWTLEAAAEARRPVGLMLVSDMTFFTGPRTYMAMARALAEETEAPVSFVFSGCRRLTEAEAALRAGFPSIVFTPEGRPWDVTLTELRDFTARAHDSHADVTGIIDGDMTPEQAAELAGVTGVDALQVAAMVEDPGNSHKFNSTCHWYPENRAWLDLDRLEKVHRLTGLPLSLNGCHNVDAAEFRRAAALGVARVDDGCPSDTAYALALREYLGGFPGTPSYFGACISIRETVKAYLRQRIEMLS